MNISANMHNINANQTSKELKTTFSEKISREEVLEIKTQISENSKEVMFSSVSAQVGIINQDDDFINAYDGFQNFLEDVGYSGKPIAELSQDEASELVSEDGIFGIAQTSERIANFVINGAAGNEDMLRAGREGMLRGFKEAEAMWGGELPEISQKTMQASIEMVDKAMHDLGFSIINQEV